MQTIDGLKCEKVTRFSIVFCSQIALHTEGNVVVGIAIDHAVIAYAYDAIGEVGIISKTSST